MFDILNLSIVFAFAIIGFYRGIVREVATLVIFLVAVFSSIHFSIPIDFIISKSLPLPLISSIISHMVVFTTVLMTAKLFFLNVLIQRIRFLSSGFDSMLGSLFGATKGLLISLMFFSCLHVSGISSKMSIQNTWFYAIDKKLYNIIGIFVTNNEVMMLNKIKNITENTKPIEDELVSDEKYLEDKNHSNLETILSTINESGNLLNDAEYQLLITMASSLSVNDIDQIFSYCCGNESSKQVNVSLRTAKLIIDDYKKSNILLDSQKILFAKIGMLLLRGNEEPVKVIGKVKDVYMIDKNGDELKNVSPKKYTSNVIGDSVPIPIRMQKKILLKKPEVTKPIQKMEVKSNVKNVVSIQKNKNVINNKKVNNSDVRDEINFLIESNVN